MLPEEAIQEFKTLYLREFGEELSDSEAARQAEKFLSLYRAVCMGRASKHDPHSGDSLANSDHWP